MNFVLTLVATGPGSKSEPYLSLYKIIFLINSLNISAIFFLTKLFFSHSDPDFFCKATGHREEAQRPSQVQGQFAVRLRQLEKALLNALKDSKGKILDDDSVIATLEKLKTEAREVATKSAKTDKVMKEVGIFGFVRHGEMKKRN